MSNRLGRYTMVHLRGADREIAYAVDDSGPGTGIAVDDWDFLDPEDRVACAELTDAEEETVLQCIVSAYDPRDYEHFEDDVI